MKSFLALLLVVTVLLGVVALGGLVSETGALSESLTMSSCGLALVFGLLYLALAARQSRLDREAREDRKRKRAQE